MPATHTYNLISEIDNHIISSSHSFITKSEKRASSGSYRAIM